MPPFVSLSFSLSPVCPVSLIHLCCHEISPSCRFFLISLSLPSPILFRPLSLSVSLQFSFSEDSVG